MPSSLKWNRWITNPKNLLVNGQNCDQQKTMTVGGLGKKYTKWIQDFEMIHLVKPTGSTIQERLKGWSVSLFFKQKGQLALFQDSFSSCLEQDFTLLHPSCNACWLVWTSEADFFGGNSFLAGAFEPEVVSSHKMLHRNYTPIVSSRMTPRWREDSSSAWYRVPAAPEYLPQPRSRPSHSRGWKVSRRSWWKVGKLALTDLQMFHHWQFKENKKGARLGQGWSLNTKGSSIM